MAIVGGMALGGCAERDSATGVVVRQVLRGDAATEQAPTTAASAPRIIEPTQMVATTLVFDQPQAIYRQAAEQARRTFDGDHLRRQITNLADTID